MKLKYILTSIMVFALLTVSCTQEVLQDHKEINVSKSIVAVPFDGGTGSFTLKTTENWTINILEDAEGEVPTWVTVSKTSGAANPEGETITFTAEQTTSNREIEVNIVSESGKVQYVIVKQATASNEIVVTPVKEITESGVDGKIYFVRGTITKIVQTLYGNWYLQDETGELYIYGTLNQFGEEKKFTDLGLAVGDKVLISGPWSAKYGNLTNVTVHEIEKSLLSVDPTEVELEDNQGGVVEFNVKCKGGLDVNIDGEWLQFSGLESNGDAYKVQFTAGANETYQPRTANITFSIKGNDKVAPVTVTVEQKGIEPPRSTIADAIAADKGTVVMIEGQVMAAGAESYVLYDGTAFLNIYKGTYNPKVGWKVKVVGKMGAYNKAPQINTPELEARSYIEEKFENPSPVVIDAAKGAELIASESIDIQYVDLVGNLSYSEKYVNIYIDGSEKAQGSAYSLTAEQREKLAPLDGKKISYKGYLLQVSGGKYLNIVMTSVEEAK